MLAPKKRHIGVFCLLLAGMTLCTSCLKSDDTEVTYNNDTAITAFSLSAANRYVHTTSSAGSDSVYQLKLSTFPDFTIDQYGKQIYNTDSLAADCDLSHLLVTISSRNSGIVVINNPTTTGADSLLYYSSTDSIDFTYPREIRVYAQDGSAYRAYQVTVNKHQIETGKLLWKQMEATDYPVDERRDRIAGLAAAAGLPTFIGAGAVEAYAFSADGLLMVSRDEGETWAEDVIDDDAALLPTEGFAFAEWPFSVNDSTAYQMLVGASPLDDEACTVWRKIAEHAAGSEPSKWVTLPVADYNRYYLPKTAQLSLVRYKGHVVAFSSNGLVYESRDQGITWKPTDVLTFPEGGYSYVVETTVGDDGYLWLRNKENGEVWRGLLME